MKTLMIDFDERLTDSVKNALKEMLMNLASDGKVNAFEVCELPQDQPKPVCGFGVLQR